MGLFGPPIKDIIVEELIRYIHSKKTGKKPPFPWDWASEGEGVNLVEDFLEWLHKDWVEGSRTKKAKEENEKLYKKIQDYFFPPAINS